MIRSAMKNQTQNELANEKDRTFDTWGTYLLDLKDQGLNPERVFGDDAGNIRGATNYVYPTVPYDIDNFHIIKDMMEMRRFFRNTLKSSITNRKSISLKKRCMAPKLWFAGTTLSMVCLHQTSLYRWQSALVLCRP